MLKRYRGVIRAAGLEWDDAAQEAWLALYRADRAFDGRRGDRPGYLWECVKRAVLAAVRRAGARGFAWTGGLYPASGFRFLAAPERVTGGGRVWVDDPKGRRAVDLPARESGRVYWTWDQWEQVLAHLDRREADVIARKYRDGTGGVRGWDMGRLTPYQSKRRQASAFRKLAHAPELAEYRPDDL